MTLEEAIGVLESTNAKTDYLLITDDARSEALDMAISALQTQDSKTRSCDTCKHNPVSKKWSCVDCDMREPADRWEKQDVPDTNVGDMKTQLPAKAKQNLQPNCNQLATDTISRQAIINSFRYDDDGTAWDIDDIVYRLEQFPSAQPEQRWIPCSERLPEPRIDVWVNSDIGQIQGYYEEHTGIWYASLGQGRDYLELIVNAWMPLPEPYRAERRTDD